MALDRIAARIGATSPERLGFYLTGRGTVNETYYAAQKAVRAMGTNSIDNAARICHAPSSIALKDTLGVAATTCSYSDWIGTDLLVFIGSNPANNQPVTTKYLHYAKKAGTKVVLVNPYREPGMERYWVPSIPESAVFGTKIADRTFLITQGGDIAFLSGALKHIFEKDLVDHAFIAAHTTGFDALKASSKRSPGKSSKPPAASPKRRCARSARWSGRRRPRSSSGAWALRSTPPARKTCAPSSIWR